MNSYRYSLYISPEQKPFNCANNNKSDAKKNEAYLLKSLKRVVRSVSAY